MNLLQACWLESKAQQSPVGLQAFSGESSVCDAHSRPKRWGRTWPDRTTNSKLGNRFSPRDRALL